MPAKPKIAQVFTRTRDFIRTYISLPDKALDVVTVWAMGTHTFSPMCTQPATYPYLYVTGPKGSGKTVLGQDVLGSICRSHQFVAGATGPALFRMLGVVDEESGLVIPLYPTLVMDEVDATFSGAKDEDYRLVLNIGYKRGASIPRVAGKTSLLYPVHCPKALLGINNGHLPDTVLDRSIQIELTRATPEEMETIEPFYSWEVEDEAAELHQQLNTWAKEESLVLREYKPKPIDGFRPRQWEIARSLVQLAHAIGNENQIRVALHSIMTANPERPDAKVELYRSIYGLFTDCDVDRVTTNQILARLAHDGVSVPGNSGKGLANVLREDGAEPASGGIRVRPDHPGAKDKDGVIKSNHRGYFRHVFDRAFDRYLEDEDY